MIDKANHLYVQWATKPEDSPPVGDHHGKEPDVFKTVQPKEAFQRTHPDLMQCVVEVHQRADVLFPLRRACKCVLASIPAVAARVAVLPELYTDRIAYGVFGAGGVPAVASLTGAISPESSMHMAIVDKASFDFGALESSWSDQGWMAWF